MRLWWILLRHVLARSMISSSCIFVIFLAVCFIYDCRSCFLFILNYIYSDYFFIISNLFSRTGFWFILLIFSFKALSSISLLLYIKLEIHLLLLCFKLFPLLLGDKFCLWCLWHIIFLISFFDGSYNLIILLWQLSNFLSLFLFHVWNFQSRLPQIINLFLSHFLYSPMLLYILIKSILSPFLLLQNKPKSYTKMRGDMINFIISQFDRIMIDMIHFFLLPIFFL